MQIAILAKAWIALSRGSIYLLEAVQSLTRDLTQGRVLRSLEQTGALYAMYAQRRMHDEAFTYEGAFACVRCYVRYRLLTVMQSVRCNMSRIYLGLKGTA